MLAMLPTVMVLAVTPVAVAPPLPPAGAWFPLVPQGALAEGAAVPPEPPLAPPPLAPPPAEVRLPAAPGPEPAPDDPVPGAPLELPLPEAPRASDCWVPVSRDPQAEARRSRAARPATTLRWVDRSVRGRRGEC